MEELQDLSWLPASIQRLALLHDAVFKHVFEDEEVFEEFVTIVFQQVFGRRVEKIATPAVQKKIDSVVGHSIIADAYCELDDGTKLIVEAQNSDNVHHPKRIRLYHSVVTVNETPKGAKYAEIPNICTIYIAKFDMFGLGEPWYVPTPGLTIRGGKFIPPDDKIRRRLDDGTVAVYVNATAFDDSPMGRLIKVLADLYELDEEICPKLTAKKNRLLRKESVMMEEYVDEFAQENYDKGWIDGRKEERENSDKQLTEISVLLPALLAQNRTADMVRIVKDHAFREKVVKELFPGGIVVAPN